MKVQIRKGVFESNSSSTHAIAISTEKDIKLRFPEKVEFKYGEFGWEESTISTVSKKASYLYTALYYVYSSDIEQWKKYIQFIAETLYENGVKSYFLGNIEQRISTYTYMKKDKEALDIYFPCSIDGYIDHGDEADEFVAAVCSDKDLLLSYLFSSHSIINTGNDNDGSDISFDMDYPYTEFHKGN